MENINPNVVNYIRKNRRKYSRQAMDEQLLKAGFSQETINESWRFSESGLPVPSSLVDVSKNNEIWVGIVIAFTYPLVALLLWYMLYQFFGFNHLLPGFIIAAIAYGVACIVEWKKYPYFVIGLWSSIIVGAVLIFLLIVLYTMFIRDYCGRPVRIAELCR